MRTNYYRVVYLIPEELLTSEIMKFQKRNLETYIEKIVIPPLCDEKELKKLREELTFFEKIFSGLLHVIDEREIEFFDRYDTSKDIMGKVASIWYAFTKKSHASMGPRLGNFVEDIIEPWIKKYRQADVKTDALLTEFFIEKFKIPLNKGREKIDFIIDDNRSRILSLIELRTSEHTGGKTGQPSLMDKLPDVLDWLEDPKIRLRRTLQDKNYEKLELCIAILFSEKDRKLLSSENYSEGRFSTLRNYILSTKNVGGKLKNLIEKHGYEISIDGGRSFVKIAYDINIFNNTLKEYRRIVLRKDGFKTEVSIVWGDEFFQRYVGKSLLNLVQKEGEELADDLWLFYTVAINEIRVLAQFGETNIKKIYNFLKYVRKDMLQTFLDVYSRKNYKEYNIGSHVEYFDWFNEYIKQVASEYLEYIENEGITIKLLDTNDIASLYNYLKKLIIVTISMIISSRCNQQQTLNKYMPSK